MIWLDGWIFGIGIMLAVALVIWLVYELSEDESLYEYSGRQTVNHLADRARRSPRRPGRAARWAKVQTMGGQR